MKLAAAALFLLPLLAPLDAQTVQTFEGIADNTPLTTQITGLTFANATVVTKGITLNDAQYPPRSGSNVVTNTGLSNITISFATPIPTVNGYYTYSGTVTVQAYNASNVLVATANSAYTNNTALSGVAGSSPNELISVSSPGGISSIVISTTAGSNSYTLDDLTYGTIFTSSVPALSWPALGGLAVILLMVGCLAAGRQARAGGMALFLLFLIAQPPARCATGAIIFVSAPPSPSFIPVNTPTSVTFSCGVTQSAGTVGTVNLVRMDTTPPTLIGAMNGGPATYSLAVTLTANSPTQAIPFQCTVGVGTSTIRAKSGNAIVNGNT